MMKLIFVLLLSFVSKIKSSKGPDWYYTNKTGKGSPSEWYKDYKICGGKRQSPINIITRETKLNDDLQPIVLNGNWNKSLTNAEYRLENNGHSIKVIISKTDNSPVLTKFKGKSYRLLQIHFHWSATNMMGSEHQFDGRAYPAEMHMVHMNVNYDSTDVAVKKEDGLLVLGTLLQIRGEPNEENVFSGFFNKFDDVLYKGDSIVLPPFALSGLTNQNFLSEYYTYPGSLTTPECQEVVTWVVFKNAMNITQDQITQIRELRSRDRAYYNTNPKDDPVVPRYRPVQPLNGRTVERSFGSFGITLNSSLLLISSLLIFIYLAL